MWLGFDVTRKTQKEEKKIAKKIQWYFLRLSRSFRAFRVT
jgi:hypothetical protein